MARTKIDFSLHKAEVIKHDGILIHKFKVPGTYDNSLIFINSCGIMSVTGDFGNWVFCREFHPSPNIKNVDSGYWDEKLQIASQQKALAFDSEKTRKLIDEFALEVLQEEGDAETIEEIENWIEELRNNVDDEFEYMYVAYRGNPDNIDYEDIPFGKKRHFWLDAVYDGFEALCQSLEQ